LRSDPSVSIAEDNAAAPLNESVEADFEEASDFGSDSTDVAPAAGANRP